MVMHDVIDASCELQLHYFPFDTQVWPRVPRELSDEHEHSYSILSSTYNSLQIRTVLYTQLHYRIFYASYINHSFQRCDVWLAERAGIYSHYEVRASTSDISFYMGENAEWVVTALDYGTDIVTVNMMVPMQEDEVNEVLRQEPTRATSNPLARNWSGIANASRGLWLRNRMETPGQAIRVSLSLRRTTSFYM